VQFPTPPPIPMAYYERFTKLRGVK